MIHCRFFRLHAVPVLLYSAAVLLFAMTAAGPVMSGVGLACGLLASAYFSGGRGFLRALAAAIPMILILTAVNPLVNTGGLTVLFRLFGRAVTKEALLYGFSSGMMLASVTVWFANLYQMAVFEKILDVFSNLFPTTAMALGLILRYIPHLIQTASRARAVRSSLCPDDGTRRNAVLEGMKTVTVVLEKSLEDSIETAKSMNARGYRRGKQKTKLPALRKEEKRLCAATVLLCAALAGFLVAGGDFAFYPRISVPRFSAVSGVLFALLCLLPVLLDGKDGMVWMTRSK